MQLKKEDIKYKEFLKIQRKLDSLYKKRRKTPKTPLKEPYQKGWMISFVLCKEALNRKDGEVLKNVLEVVTVPYYTNDVTKIRIARKNKRWKDYINQINIAYGDRAKNKYYRTSPEFKSLKVNHFEKLSAIEQQYFYKVEEQGVGRYSKVHASFHIDIPDYYIEVKVYPNIITHSTIVDPEILRLESFLEAKRDELVNTGNASDKWRNYASSYPANKGRARFRELKQKFIKGEIEDIPVEKIPKEYDY